MVNRTWCGYLSMFYYGEIRVAVACHRAFFVDEMGVSIGEPHETCIYRGDISMIVAERKRRKPTISFSESLKSPLGADFNGARRCDCCGRFVSKKKPCNECDDYDDLIGF